MSGWMEAVKKVVGSVEVSWACFWPLEITACAFLRAEMAGAMAMEWNVRAILGGAVEDVWFEFRRGIVTTL